MMSSTTTTTTRIQLPEPPNDPKLKSRLEILTEKGSNIVDFVGSEDVETLFLIYLLKKYKSDCFIRVEKGIPGLGGDINRLLGLTLIIGNEADLRRGKDNHLRLCQYLAEQVVRCIMKKTRIVIIPVNLIFFKYNPDGTHKVVNGILQTSGHANVLIYRSSYHHMELYEPHGSFHDLDEHKHETVTIRQMIGDFVDALNKELRLKSMPPVNLLKTTTGANSCPIRGFQSYEGRSTLQKDATKEPIGYCAAWSMFFTELCLKNPDIPIRELHRRILYFVTENKKKEDFNKEAFFDYFRVLIRGYANVIDEKITKYFSTQFGEQITVAKLKNYQKHDITRYNQIKSKIRDLINLEVRLFGEDGTSYFHILQHQVTRTQQAIDEITSKKRKKNIEEYPRIYPKYLELQNQLEVLKSQVSDFNSRMELENMPHSSASIKSKTRKRSSLASSTSISNKSKSRSRSRSKSKDSDDSLLDLIEEMGTPPDDL